MKKNLLLLAIAFIGTIQLSAQVRTVSNSTNSPGQYYTLQEAINAANSGDTLYVHGSAASYGSVTVNKRLTIIGAGFNPQSQFGLSTIIGNITLDTVHPTHSSLGSIFIGLQISSILKKTTDFVQIDNITFDRCRFTANAVTSICGNSYVFRNCIFSWSAQNGYVDCGNYSNLLFTNCIFNFATSTAHQGVSVLQNSNKSSVVINNNIFTGFHAGNSFSSVSNAQITNNIFFGKSPLGASSSSFLNNLTWGNNPDLPYGNNSGQDNIIFQDPMFVSVPVSTFSFSFSHDFDLQAGSPAKNAGTDGTDLGVFGGTYPMLRNNNQISGESRLPQIYFMSISNSVIDQNTPINVTVKARKMD